MPSTMPSYKVIRSVLHNFIGTYTSRYSDYDGYWLFGLLAADLDQLSGNLLDAKANRTAKGAPLDVAVQLAATKFREQIDKAGMSRSCIREADLSVTKSPELRSGWINGRVCAGYQIRFAARVVSDRGMTYEHEKSLFVAPHNPSVEFRSASGT